MITVWLYTLLIIAILVLEKEIYDSRSATHTVHIAEIILAAIFGVDIVLALIAFKFTQTFNDKWNYLEIIFILLTIIWGSLELSDSNKFRVLGAYRLYRVWLLYIKLYHTKVLVDARKYLYYINNHQRSPKKQVYNILSFLKNNIKNSRLAYEIMYCIDMIKSGKLDGTHHAKQKRKEDEKDDRLEWARTNSTESQKPKLDEARKIIQKKVAKIDIASDLRLTDKMNEILDRWLDYEFDILALERETNGNEMTVLSSFLMYKHDFYTTLWIDPTTFATFIKSIQHGYNDVAYHNKIHGMDVGRLAYYYAMSWELKEKAQLSELDLFGLLIGGACHDFDHIGWNNAYLIETQHEWAVTYNDVSVCENHHIAATFDLIQKRPDCNIFENFSIQDFKNIRKKLTKSVLATDMALHFDYVNKFKAFLADKNIDPTSEENKTFLMCMWLHISDLTNPTKQWSESQQWTWLVYEEFFVQGDKEKELGLPVGDLNDRKKINLASSQIGFINFIVQPSIELFAAFLPRVNRNIDQVKINKENWASMVEECKELQNEGNDLIKRFKQLQIECYENKHHIMKKTADVADPLDDHFEGLDPDKNYKILDKPTDNPTLTNRLDSELKEN